jgi:predicted nucleic acid-binding protein
MSPYLVDSSAWIFSLRRDSVESIKHRIDELLAQNAVTITGMIRLELLAGARTRPEFDQLNFPLSTLPQLETVDDSWVRAGRLAFDLRRRGLTVPLTDVLIASTALENDATILHADTHFDRIAEHTELKVESYVRDIERGAHP